MTTSESIGALFAGMGGICLGCAMLCQLKRETVHPWFKTWWAKYLEEPDSIDKMMCEIVGTGFLLIGLLLLLSGIATLFS